MSPLVYSNLVSHLDPAHRDPQGFTESWAASRLLRCHGYRSIGYLPPSPPSRGVDRLLRLPKVERTEEESAGTLSMYRQLMRNPLVWLYFLAIIAYVGCEQGTADWMSPFLERYHHVDPHKGVRMRWPTTGDS